MQSLTLPLTDLPADSPLAIETVKALRSYGVLAEGQTASLHRGQIGPAVIYRVGLPSGTIDVVEPAGVEKQGTEELASLIAQGVKASVR